MNKLPVLSAEEILAIAYGYHGDPFAVLGPHAYEEGVVIRTLHPPARSIEVLLPDGGVVAMNRLHEAGLFEAVLPGQSYPLSYQLRLVAHYGDESVLADPYAFPSALSQFDEHLLAEGTHQRMYERMGAHLMEINGRSGVFFAVWAPNALRVSVVGDFNNWDGRRHPMRFHHDSGIWELFIPGLREGVLYKYQVKGQYRDYTVAKTDPVGFRNEMRPNTASIVYNLNKYTWNDQEWVKNRPQYNNLNAPISIYEVHLGSWRRKNGWQWLTYHDLTQALIPYVKEMGYTHIELLPITEHPYDGSWGYQVTGYFAPTSRFGTPDEFMAFVDACHQEGIGVILDWVPAHFPRDQHGLALFDGTHLYEHEDPRRGTQPDWGTLVFNYGRNEVVQFLISNALFWIDKYHLDGLRVDAVASMLYLDFSREHGQWLPNRLGGRENLEAIEFLRRFNEAIHQNFPGTLTIAEESTAWPGVTRAVSEGGLGFDLKWNMGWMHDSLKYFKNDPVYRSFHHGVLTFSLLYAFSEKYMLPFSHDEVVHLKKSMLDKMPGDLWQKYANLRLLYGYQWAHPGKKLLFMGGEFGQWREWSEERGLDWGLLEDEKHHGLHDFVQALNHFYQENPSFYEDDNSWEGFQWVDLHDAQHSILAFARIAPKNGDLTLVVCNFTPVVRQEYRLAVAKPGKYVEVLNSDSAVFGGSNVVNEGEFETNPTPWYGQPYSIQLTLPPLGIIFIKPKAEKTAESAPSQKRRKKTK